MPKHILTRGHSRALTRHHKIAAAGVAALGAAAIGFSAVPSNASTTTTAEAPAQTAKVAYSTKQIEGVQADVNSLHTGAVQVEQFAAQKKAAAEAAAKKKAAAEAKAAKARAAAESASRSAERAEVKKAAPQKYGDNLDGWIREALSIMKKNGIPGSYEGIHRNIMRESSGNPKAINLWDINAQKGIPPRVCSR